MFKEEFLKELALAKAKHEKEVKPFLEDREEYKTISKIPVKPLYTPLDIAGIDYKEIGFPGEFPYTRGNFHAGFISRSWNSRQVVGLGTAEETNKRWKSLISMGMTGLAVVGATKSDLGIYDYDTRDERTIGFAGKDGVQLDTLADYETLFDGIDLTKFSIHIITSSAIALASYIAVAEKRGIPQSELRGSMSNAVRPTRDCFDIIEYCAQNLPNFNATYIDVRNIRDAGATAPQEIAFGIAFGMAAADTILARGIDIDQFAARVSWFVSAGHEVFEEVAKFRVMRRLWAKTMAERYGVKDPRSLRLKAHVQTHAPSLTYQQPLNNIIRSTIYALSAVLGGAQSLSVNCFDEALAIPTELSQAIALRTQQIIYFETGVTDVIDPLAGSYYVEWLTNRLEEEARKIIEEVEARGGAFKALPWMIDQVRQAAYLHEQELNSGKRKHVGVNCFIEEEDLQLKLVTSQEGFLHEYDSTIRDKQIERIEKVLQERDNAQVEVAKKRLFEAFKSGENMLPPLIEAVKAYMTAGEIAVVCKEALGKTDDYFKYFQSFFFTD